MQRCNDQETFDDCLTPMQRLATSGMLVLLPHHLPRIGDLDSVAHDIGCYFGTDCIAHTHFTHTHGRSTPLASRSDRPDGNAVVMRDANPGVTADSSFATGFVQPNARAKERPPLGRYHECPRFVVEGLVNERDVAVDKSLIEALGPEWL
jgi:hypothetical protein